jgi:hypothetical protein
MRVCLLSRAPDDEVRHVPEVTWPVPVGVHGCHDSVLGFSLARVR